MPFGFLPPPGFLPPTIGDLLDRTQRQNRRHPRRRKRKSRPAPRSGPRTEQGRVQVPRTSTSHATVGPHTRTSHITAVAVQDEGAGLGDAVTLNFVGAGVSAALVGSTATVTISAGGGQDFRPALMLGGM